MIFDPVVNSFLSAVQTSDENPLLFNAAVFMKTSASFKKVLFKEWQDMQVTSPFSSMIRLSNLSGET